MVFLHEYIEYNYLKSRSYVLTIKFSGIIYLLNDYKSITHNDIPYIVIKIADIIE